MNLRQRIKANAKLALKGNWGKMVAFWVLVLIVQYFFQGLQGVILLGFGELTGLPVMEVASGVELSAETLTPEIAIIMLVNGGASLLCGLGIFLLTGPLEMGIMRYALRLVECREQSEKGVLHYFRGRLWLRALGAQLAVGVRLALWGILFVFPGILLIGIFLGLAATLQEQLQFVAVLGALAGIGLLMVGMIAFVVISLRYELALWFVAEDDSVPIGEAIRQSVEYSKGVRGELLLFMISFFFWQLLSIFVFPVPFVNSYYTTSLAIYAKYLHNQGVAREMASRPVMPPPPSDVPTVPPVEG
ncbi:MAG: DUF975 family protein [Oscillospiraceae bacterium]|nr:DUF975 family protein [Oscillospiraceae bacterium]